MEWQAALKAGDRTAHAVLETLRTLKSDLPATDTVNANERARLFDNALNKACLAWLEEDAGLAAESGKEVDKLVSTYEGSDLGKGANALAAVQAWDFCEALWGAEERAAFAERIAGIARSFLEIGKGNPHIVTNNWWMLTHGGCLLACIAVDGERGTNGRPIDLSDLKAWALERFKAFCHVFGNAGLYHEGSGYIAYTLSMLMPTLVAVERHLEPDILGEFPRFRRSIASMIIGTAPFEHVDSGGNETTFGAALQWNDAGRSCLGLNPFVPGMAVAPAEWRGALRVWFDRLIGIDGRRAWECPYRGLPLVVALYPFSTTPREPEEVLPKWTVDQRQGLGMWRSAWGDGSESVFGWYARATHAGGHRQDDAASIRLMSLGRTWICGGGQARAKAEWQSVFTHADMKDRPKPAPLAHLTCNRLSEHGGVVGIDTRQSLGAYSERYLSWRTDLGVPFALAIMDLLDDHSDPPRDWQWNLSFPRELESGIDEDGAGFTLVDPEKGTLHGRFLVDIPPQLEVAEMPASSRTFSNGKKVDYPGDRYIHARFPSWSKARILLVLAIVPPGKAAPEIHFRDNAAFINGQEWNHPFFPAILKSVDLAQSAPNRMTRPAG